MIYLLGKLLLLISFQGAIFVRDDLDRERYPTYALTITAVDNAGSSSNSNREEVIVNIELLVSTRQNSI